METGLFNSSKLISIILPESVTEISANSFYNCSLLTYISIPSTVTSIGMSAFSGCSSLSKVNISSLDSWLKINFIGSGSNPCAVAHHLYLNDEELTSVDIPASITSVKNNVFQGCSALTSITIPASITTIGSNAFSDCSSLTSLTFSDTTYWYKKASASAAASTATQVDVTTPAQNATWFTSTEGYYDYWWYKTDEPAEE